jgi:purine-binding chemotaxis protein CheW
MNQAQQFCTFFLDGHYFGVEVEKVQEVRHHQDMTRVPLTPPVIQGLINLRGQIVAALDLRRRLFLKERPAGEAPMNVVLRAADGAVSLLVDEIDEVLEVSEDVFEPPPKTLQGNVRELIRGAYKLKDRIMLVLDVEKTLQTEAPGRHSGE